MQDLLPCLDSALNFIDESIKNNQNILIHCQAGVSRSVAIACAYIMKQRQTSVEDTLNSIRALRPSAELVGNIYVLRNANEEC